MKRESSKIVAIIALGASIALGGAGCLTESSDEEMRDDNEEMRDDNEEMRDDNEKMRDDNEKMRDDEENIIAATRPIVYSGHDYLFVVTPKDWNAAQTYCQLNGYNLVTVNSAGEETFLAAEEARHGGGNWWIGWSDQGIEGLWAWTDGTAPTYSNWSPNQPDNAFGNEDCAHDNYYSGGQWNDAGCGNAFKFICERTTIPTANTGSYSCSTSDTNNATQNTCNRTVTLYHDQTLTVGTCGIPGASFYGNTLIRLFKDNVEVASNDDSCGGGGSNFSYVAPSTGSYTIKTGCSMNGNCNGTIAWTKSN